MAAGGEGDSATAFECRRPTGARPPSGARRRTCRTSVALPHPGVARPSTTMFQFPVTRSFAPAQSGVLPKVAAHPEGDPGSVDASPRVDVRRTKSSKINALYQGRGEDAELVSTPRQRMTHAGHAEHRPTSATPTPIDVAAHAGHRPAPATPRRAGDLETLDIGAIDASYQGASVNARLVSTPKPTKGGHSSLWLDSSRWASPTALSTASTSTPLDDSFGRMDLRSPLSIASSEYGRAFSATPGDASEPF